MKAIVFTEYGSIDVLQLKEVEKPVPEDNEVLLKVHAASVNDWDLELVLGTPLFMRYFYGLLKPKPTVQIPGCDVAGHIEAVGKNVARLKPGDAVYGDLCMSGFGGFAEYVCAPEHALELKPASMTFLQAASLPQAAQLAVQSLIDTGNLQAGQKLLINGAGGGVGTIGVQIAKSIGAEITVVDSAMKLEMLRALGADHVIDYTVEDFTRNTQQYDLILDTKTSRSMLDYTRALTPEGMYVTVGGSMPRILQSFFLKPWISLTSNKKTRIISLKPNKDLGYMNKMFEAGKVVPVIDGPYKLSEVAAALRYFEKAEHKGKVMISID
ncbi:MAG: NAD(P)-dependent alcohol dehydrogenase [Proteobacteria bacterium]|nr:NAD(P)-dependent alcohol dehydrogenase [Pseudomonadota bacterium]